MRNPPHVELYMKSGQSFLLHADEWDRVRAYFMDENRFRHEFVSIDGGITLVHMGNVEAVDLWTADAIESCKARAAEY